MDKWKESELERMKVGGNAVMRKFLESQPDWKPSLPFQDKWNTKAAALARDKVAAESEGRSWDISSSSAQSWVPPVARGGGGGGGGGGGPGREAGRQWAESGGGFQSGGGGNGYQSGGSSRYQGFGNTPDPGQGRTGDDGELLSSALGSLSVGWGAFSRAAASAASYTKDIGSAAAAKTASATASIGDKVKDGSLLSGAGAAVTGAAAKAGQLGMMGWERTQSTLFGQGGKGYSNLDEDDTLGRSMTTPNLADAANEHHQGGDDGAAWSWDQDNRQASASYQDLATAAKTEERGEKKKSSKGGKKGKGKDAGAIFSTAADDDWGAAAWDDKAWEELNN